MHDGRYAHSTTVLPDGRVVIIGGVVPSADRTDPEPAPVEIFDPSSSHDDGRLVSQASAALEVEGNDLARPGSPGLAESFTRV